MDKPFLTFDEQIEKLKVDYNLTIVDNNFAKEVLSSISYYDLINGYQSIYRANDKYADGTTLELLFTMHSLNKNIQGVLLKYSTYVENSFKTLLSYVIAENFSVHQDNYLAITNYEVKHKSHQRERLKELLKKLATLCKECKHTPTKHYRITKDHIPPWILFRNITFSDAEDLFTFMKRKDKENLFTHLQIYDNDLLNYDNKVIVTIDSLRLVRKFRNKIAHNLDFLTYRGASLNKSANKLFVSTLVLDSEINKTRNDIWAMIISIVILLNNKFLVQNFLAEFNSFMQSYEALVPLYCSFAGIPSDFQERIKRYLVLNGFTDFI